MAIEKFTTKSIVLAQYDQGEHDRVYKVFTRDFGVIMVHAKSIRKLESKLRPHLQVGTKALLTLVKGREVWRVTGAEEENEVTPYIHEVIVVVTRFMRGEGAHSALFDRLSDLVSPKVSYDGMHLRVLVYYIVLVDLGYADSSVIGASSRQEYAAWSIDDIYTRLLLSYDHVRKHVHTVLKESQL